MTFIIELYHSILLKAPRACMIFAATCIVQQSLAQSSKTGAGKATLKDSIDVYNNAIAVQEFYEHTGLYKKTRENRLKTSDPEKLHAGNDKKYAEVLKTINNNRMTPEGSRKIKPEEYRINIDKYRYKQRELSDYVLNTDAPMQLFDRRIAPQLLVDFAYTGTVNSAMNADDVDFKMYDPIAVKPYSKLTAEEKIIRDTKYPPLALAETKTAPSEKVAPLEKPHTKPIENKTGSTFFISGNVPDSLRFKRFKTRKEAEDFIKTIQSADLEN